MTPRKDISGQQFGTLIAVKPTEQRVNHKVVWECLCSCGRDNCPKIVYAQCGNLISGNSKSCKQQRYDTRLHPAIRSYYSFVRGGAKHRGYAFELSIEQFHMLIKQPCYYCGSNDDTKLVGAYTYKQWRLRANGIDRLVNSIGYVLNNCVACCKRCNIAKADMSVQEYIALAKRIAERH